MNHIRIIILIVPFVIINGLLTGGMLRFSNKQRRYDFYQKYQISKTSKDFQRYLHFYEHYQRLLDEKELKETQRKNKEFEARRKIFEKYLLTVDNDSSFLRDFHTRRF
jgi:hypothetical protein